MFHVYQPLMMNALEFLDKENHVRHVGKKKMILSTMSTFTKFKLYSYEVNFPTLNQSKEIVSIKTSKISRLVFIKELYEWLDLHYINDHKKNQKQINLFICKYLNYKRNIIVKENKFFSKTWILDNIDLKNIFINCHVIDRIRNFKNLQLMMLKKQELVDGSVVPYITTKRNQIKLKTLVQIYDNYKGHKLKLKKYKTLYLDKNEIKFSIYDKDSLFSFKYNKKYINLFLLKNKTYNDYKRNFYKQLLLDLYWNMLFDDSCS